MINIRSGVLKKVITQDQYEAIKNEVIDAKDIILADTIRNIKMDDGKFLEYLPFRLSYKEVDAKGNEKYTFDELKNEYVVCYNVSPIINAYNKELRILIEMSEYTPIKVAVNEDGEHCRALCIQNQLAGKLDQ